LSKRGILRTLFLLSLFILAPISASAATYYVAPNGSNSNPGTQAAPFATLQKGHDVAVAGDTIYMRGGTYTLSTYVNINRSGSSGNPIKVFNYPGETPVLDAINITTSYWSVIQLSNASWWHFKGLELKNGPAQGLVLSGDSSNNIVEFNNVHHNTRVQSSGSGIAVSDTSANNLILNNDSHHNGVPGTSGGDGIGVTPQPQVTGNVVRGNRVWRNNDDGIDLWNAANVLIENNWSWQNGYNDALQPSGGNGNGFKLGGAGPSDGKHTVKNNLSWRNLVDGFHETGGDLPITLYNNTAWNNGRQSFTFFNGATTFRNNISFGSLGSISGSDTFNSWTLGVTHRLVLKGAINVLQAEFQAS